MFDEFFIKATGIETGPFDYQRKLAEQEELPQLLDVAVIGAPVLLVYVATINTTAPLKLLRRQDGYRKIPLSTAYWLWPREYSKDRSTYWSSSIISLNSL